MAFVMNPNHIQGCAQHERDALGQGRYLLTLPATTNLRDVSAALQAEFPALAITDAKESSPVKVTESLRVRRLHERMPRSRDALPSRNSAMHAPCSHEVADIQGCLVHHQRHGGYIGPDADVCTGVRLNEIKAYIRN